jgi:hypothetical protein
LITSWLLVVAVLAVGSLVVVEVLADFFPERLLLIRVSPIISPLVVVVQKAPALVQLVEIPPLELEPPLIFHRKAAVVVVLVQVLVEPVAAVVVVVLDHHSHLEEMYPVRGGLVDLVMVEAVRVEVVEVLEKSANLEIHTRTAVMVVMVHNR